MKNLFLFLCCFLLAATVHCQKKEDFKKSPLAGTWVENSTKTDTLEFLPEYDGMDPIFRLKRGKNNNNLPKSYSGSYWYKLSEDTISVQWLLSSLLRYQDYYFKLSQNKDTIKMGNFFNKGEDKPKTLTFVKLSK